MSAANIAPAGLDTEGSRRLMQDDPAPARPGRDALRDAALSALVAAGLFLPMVGLVTHERENGQGLLLQWRPVPVAVLVALVFLGRLALRLWQGNRPARVYRSNRAFAEALTRSGRFVAPLLLLIALTMPFYADRRWIDLGTLILIYVMLGWGLNIVVGLAGLLDLGYVAFYAVGAYSFALFSTRFGLGFWECLPIAGALAGLWGILLGFPVLRLRGDYLAIVTLAFGEIIRVVILNWTSLTNGPNGILDIPRPTLFGLKFTAGGGSGTFAGFFGLQYSLTQRVAFLYYIILGLALLTNWVSLRLRRVPLGRAWEALREDEIACRVLGINVTVTKLTAFAIGATFGGFAGAFFATRNAFISPESFTFIESAIVLLIVVLGGLGSQLGVALAAIVAIGGADLLQPLATYRMLIFGLVLVTVMVLRPRGLVSGRTPSVVLGKRREIAAELVAEGRG